MTPQVRDALAVLTTSLRGAEASDLVELFAALTGLRAQVEVLLLTLASAVKPRTEADRWLTPKEAAAVLRVSPTWLYRRWRRFSWCHPLGEGARGFRVSERELMRYLAGRR